MRITQNQIWDTMAARLQTSTVRLSKAQERVVTGLRVNRPSDDPTATSRIIGLKSEIERLDQYQKNAEEAQGRLDSAAEALTQMSELLSEAVSLGQWGATGTNSATDRETIARDVDSLIDRAMSLANTRFGRTYLFAGTSNEGPPYSRDVSTDRVVYGGNDEERRVPIAPGLHAEADVPGSVLFGGNDRGATRFEGDTGALPGQGTDSGTARASLRLRHTATVTGDGLGPGGADSASGVTAGASSAADDTILGSHVLTLTVDAGGASGTVSLDGGAAISFTTASASDLAVTSDGGDRVHLDLTGVTAGFSGAVSLRGDGTLSTDGGLTEAAIDFTSAQAVTDSRTGEVTHVDTRTVERTGTERVDYEGTFDIFAALEALRDELQNVDGRDESQLSDAIAQRVSELTRAHDDLLLGIGTVGARSAGMSVSVTQLADLELQLEGLRSDLQDVDIAEAAMHLTEQENVYRAALAVGARVSQPTLLDYL